MCDLKEYENLIVELIDYRKWLSGDASTKKQMMQEILRFSNGYFGMDVELSFTLPEGFEAANGLMDPETGDIMVNESLFDDPREFLPLFIFLHELRHGIQKAKTELFSEEIAVNCEHIIQFDGTGYRVEGKTVTTVQMEGPREFFTELYLGSPAEIDANRFAYETLRQFGDDEALEEHYRIWSPSYKVIPEENMLGEFLKACEQIDRLANEAESGG